VDQRNETGAAARPRGVRVRPWELLLYTVVIAGLAYWAGYRGGVSGTHEPQSVEASPHGSASEAPTESAPSPGPSMGLDQIKANLAKISDVKELVGIANQHLDSARNSEGKDKPERTRMFYTVAVAAYERALELQPKDPNLLTDLGIAYRGLGDPQTAVARFREAAAADPKHTQSRFNLGLVLLSDLQATDQAKAAWEDYLRIAPKGDPNRKDVQEALDKLK